MKKFLLIFFITSFIPAHLAFSSERETEMTALASFESVVEHFTAFFKKSPLLLTKISPPRFPQKKAYNIARFTFRSITYDILKTSSIVTPFAGYIDILTDVSDNKPCGDVKFDGKTPDGWSRLENAIRNADNKACYVSRTNKIGPIGHRFNFLYRIREGTWVLKDITYVDGNINGRFMALLGVSSPWFPAINEPAAKSFNKGWIYLFTNP